MVSPSQAWYRCVSVDLTWLMNLAILLQPYLQESACTTHDKYTYVSIYKGMVRVSCNQRSYTTHAVKGLHIHQGANCSHKVWQ